MNNICNYFMRHRKTALLKQYLFEFQERIDKGHQLACSNKLTQKSFLEYRKDVCELLAGYKKNFGNESFADFYIIHSIDILSVSTSGVEAENTSDADRDRQLQRYIINLESIVNAIVRDFQFRESKLQTCISFFAVLVAIIVPSVLNCCSHKIDSSQFNTLINTLRVNTSVHTPVIDTINTDKDMNNKEEFTEKK